MERRAKIRICYDGQKEEFGLGEGEGGKQSKRHNGASVRWAYTFCSLPPHFVARVQNVAEMGACNKLLVVHTKVAITGDLSLGQHKLQRKAPE